MKLSDVKDTGSIEIITDGSFGSVGYFHQKNPDQLSFLDSFEDAETLSSNPAISCLITKKELAAHLTAGRPIGLAFSDNPRKSFFEIHNYLAKNTGFYGPQRPKVIGKNTHIHPSATISDADVVIGDDCSIGPHVTIYDGSVIGNNVTVGAGTTIGSGETGCILIDNKQEPLVRAGGVRIHDHVDIHANCCIAGALFGGYTEIGDSTKIDNLVHIGQGTTIGRRSMVVALAVIGEEVVIGNDVWIGPGAIISDNTAIGDNAYITLGSVVTENVLPGQQVTGNFAIEHKKFLKFLKTIR